MISTNEFESVACQWQETIKILIQSFNRILTKYLTYEPKIDSITEHIYQKSFYLFRITNKNIFTEVSIILKILLNSQILDFRRKQTLLEEMETWLKKNKNQGQAVHDMMNILMTIIEDIAFISVKSHFQLLMRIYIEIVYFSSFSDEYSTYFYNLEILTKAFLKNLFFFLNSEDKNMDSIFMLFVNCLPEMFITKIINKKANETGCNFLSTFFDEIIVNLHRISIQNFKIIFEKLFLLVSLRSLPSYTSILETEKECLYVLFYEKLKLVVEKLIEFKMKHFCLLICDFLHSKSLLINEIFELKNIKFREKIIENEVAIASSLIFYVLQNCGQLKTIKTFDFPKFLNFTHTFKNNFLKIESLIGLKLEDKYDNDECFVAKFYKHLMLLLYHSMPTSLKFQVLHFLKSEFSFYAENLRHNQIIDKK